MYHLAARQNNPNSHKTEKGGAMKPALRVRHFGGNLLQKSVSPLFFFSFSKGCFYFAKFYF